jgi:hypothetical protein
MSQLVGEAPISTGLPGPPAAANPRVTQLLDDALDEYRAALAALQGDDLAGYQQHLEKMVADLQQADQLGHAGQR